MTSNATAAGTLGPRLVVQASTAGACEDSYRELPPLEQDHISYRLQDMSRGELVMLAFPAPSFMVMSGRIFAQS